MFSAICWARSSLRSGVSINGHRCDIGPRVPPQPMRDWQRVDLDPLPPSGLVPMPVQLAMMDTAYRNGALVADLAA
jgi:hypothetical protein